MPKPSERKRLKDRIVESISKAVKQIQRLNHDRNEEIVLSNDDWQFRKLVGHLDHALMHGLRHITNGYWVVVQEFTPKATIKEINMMQNITTNLGRGRAWLYVALMDRLLESYIKCYIDNRGRVSKFYMKEALMVDQQSLDVIHTLSAGLEFITFNLEVDMPYLDLSTYQLVKNSSCEEEECDNDDRQSLASTNSTMSLNTTAEITEMGIDAVSLQSGDVADSSQYLHASPSTPVFQEQPQVKVFTTRCYSLDATAEEENNTEIEVIRHKIKIHHHKIKRKKKKGDTDSLSSVDTDQISFCSRTKQDSPVSCSSHISQESPLCVLGRNVDSPLTPESGYRSVMDNNSPKGKLFEDNGAGENNVSVYGSNMTSTEVIPEDTDAELQNQEVDSNQNDSKKVDIQSDSNCTQDTNDSKDIVSEQSSQYSNSHLTNVPNNADSVHSSQNNYNSSSKLISQDNNDDSQTNMASSNTLNSSSDEGIGSQGEDIPTASLENSINESTLKADVTDLLNKSVEIDQIYGSSSREKVFVKSDNAKKLSNGTKDVRQKSGEGLPVKSIHSPERDTSKDSNNSSGIRKTEESIPDWEYRVDNNTKLYLMLEVFQAEEEIFLKMFKTCLGHTEGEVVPVHLVITDCAIYITTPALSNLRFHREAAITFKELDYISLSMGYQVINIVCTNRRKQFWITTGDEALTKCIVRHVDNAISHSTADLPRLSVLTDATTQKIAIKKWAATECPSLKTELKILDYSLVYWDDAETNTSSWLQIAATKSGTLHYKSHNAYFGFGGPVWKSAYFVLKDGALFMYHSQHDSVDNSPAVSCLQLNHEECQGCRSCRSSDRDYSLEILLKDGSSLQLSADDLTECQEWLQSLCQVVAQGMGSLPPSSGCLACCSVLTSTRLLLCHEDVQTNFLRTLAAANIMDISAVQVDKTVNTYCVLKFDSPNHDEHQKWILFFNSHSGRDCFLSALEQAWAKLFQVAILISDVDLTIQSHCRESVNSIRQQRNV